MGGRTAPGPRKKNNFLAATGPSHVHLFIHSFVCSFVYSFIHSFVCSFFHLDHNQIPFIIAYIERRQAEIDLIVSLAANFQMNRLTRWPFIILSPNKGGSVEKINLYQRFELLYIERKQVEIDQIVALSIMFPINLNMD